MHLFNGFFFFIKNQRDVILRIIVLRDPRSPALTSDCAEIIYYWSKRVCKRSIKSTSGLPRPFQRLKEASPSRSRKTRR